MRSRHHSGTAHQTVGKRFRYKLRLRCTFFRKELRVLCNQLNLISYFCKFNQFGTAHLTAVQTAFADGARNVVREEKGFVQLTGQDFQPNFFIFLVQSEKARR